MIYWVSETINTSIRYYADNAREAFTASGPKPVERIKVPTGVASFPGDAPLPKEWAERMANVTRFTKMPKGGHFAAWSVPDLWVAEVRKFFFENNAKKNAVPDGHLW